MFFQGSDRQETVKINLFKVVVLRNDAAQKAKERIQRLDREIKHVDQADLAIQLKHVLDVFIEKDDSAFCPGHRGVGHLQKVFCFAFAFSAGDDLNHGMDPPMLFFNLIITDSAQKNKPSRKCFLLFRQCRGGSSSRCSPTFRTSPSAV